MADNTSAYKSSEQTTLIAAFATDDIGGVQYPRTKITIGADGVSDGDVSSANPLPVTAASLPLPTGAATAADQATANTSLATLAGAVSGTEMQVDIVTMPNVTIANASLAVTGTFWQATQPVSIAAAVAVTDNGDSLTVDDGGSTISIDDGGGSITVDGSVSVSGEVDVLPASPIATDYLPVRLTDGTSFVSALPITDNSGSITVDDGNGSLSIDDNNGSITVDNAGTFAVQAAQSGTWNIGTVTTVSAVTAISNALPAGTNLLGRMSSSPETSTIYNGTTALTPKFATIAASSSGNNTIVAAVTSKKIRVLAYNLIANGTVDAKFQSGAGGTDITGPKYCVANSGICAPFNPAGWFETAAGALLNLNLSAAVAVGGELVYVEV